MTSSSELLSILSQVPRSDVGVEHVSVVGISIEDPCYRRFIIKPVFRRTAECWPESEAWKVIAWWWSSYQVICRPVGISHGIISEPKKYPFVSIDVIST